MPEPDMVVFTDPSDAGDDALTSPVARAMRGRTELPVPDADVYPGLMDAAKLKKVYKLWMSGAADCATVAAAAAKAGVSEATALYWAERGDWLLQKRRLLKVRAGEQAVALENMRAGMRTEEAMAQIDAAQSLRKRASELLDGGPRTVLTKKGEAVEIDGLSPMDLKFLADSMKAGSDIIGRFMGIAEPRQGSAQETASGEEPEAVKKAAPLVIVVKGGGLPQVRSPGKVIDV